MPETIYGENRAPLSSERHAKLLTWCQRAYQAARDDRSHYEGDWRRYYRLFDSWVQKTDTDWRSRRFIPETFTAITTALPHDISQLPKFLANPTGEEDVEGAELLEFLMQRAVDMSKLYIALYDTFLESRLYGTGILKVFPAPIERTGEKLVPIFEEQVDTVRRPLIDPETGLPLRDPDGNPVLQDEEFVTKIPSGYDKEAYTYEAYYGPMAKCIDPFHLFPAPDSEDVQSARYIIHRDYLDVTEVEKRIEEGIYNWPGDGQSLEHAFEEEDPKFLRLSEVGRGSSGDSDDTRRQCEVLEYWTKDGKVITVINQKAVVRVQDNPFNHKMKPFVRFLNYRMPHEFWGRGDVHHMEGLQDIVNELTNMRIDEVKLKLHKMYIGNPDLLVDVRDTASRPGGLIRTYGDADPSMVLKAVDFGDVNSSAYTEVAETQRMIERVTAASSVQQGVDAPDTETATGMNLLYEQGSSRYGMKSKLNELDPYMDLSLMYGTLIQQFTQEEEVVRMLGPDGSQVFKTISPDSLTGAYDFTIDTSSVQQSETVKREQAMGLLQTLAEYSQVPDPMTGMPIIPVAGVRKALEDVLDAFGKKDKASYLGPALPQQGPMGMLPPPPDVPTTDTEVPSQTPVEQGIGG